MGKKKLKFVTANCSGNPPKDSSKSKDTTGCRPAKVRWSLLDPTWTFEEGAVPPDVYFLQEISFMRELRSDELSLSSSFYHVFIPEAGAEAGLLLLQETFEEEPEFFTGSQGRAAPHLEEINAEYEDEGVTLDGNRVAFAVATPRGSNVTLLLVSYHGQYKTKNKQLLLKMLLELCERLRREVDASDFVIGGDFNLSADDAREVSESESESESEYGVAAAEPSSRRAHLDVVDYFIHTRESFNVTDVRLGQFNDDVRESLGLTESDLRRYLDHDPIEMSATVGESDAGSDAGSEETGWFSMAAAAVLQAATEGATTVLGAGIDSAATVVEAGIDSTATVLEAGINLASELTGELLTKIAAEAAAEVAINSLLK